MALPLPSLSLTPLRMPNNLLFFNGLVKAIQPKHNARARMCSSSVDTRRSVDYTPTVWDYNSLVSFPIDFKGQDDERKKEEMIDKVKWQLIQHDAKANTLDKLELIDIIQRLGLEYCFKPLIKDVLGDLYQLPDVKFAEDLHATSLHFRLLRQHGFPFSSDVFEKFRDKSGKFKDELQEDVKGLLSLYEASFLGFEEDHILHETKVFATKQLKEMKEKVSPDWARKVEYALDMPWHWRVPRLEARWWIENYAKEEDHNPTLLQLSKLNFNIMQLKYREEIGVLARWWMELDLSSDKQSNARDRLIEHYIWVLSMLDEPQFSEFRVMHTKLTCLLTAIDDVYDVFGTHKELQPLTHLIHRWEINGIEELPDFIKKCYLAIYNTSNEIGYWFLKEKGFYIIPYLSKVWGDLCKAHMKDIQWMQEGYMPTFNESLDNGTISISGVFMLSVCYFLTTSQLTKEALEYFLEHPDFMLCCSKIFRLVNDLGTSAHEVLRGDTLKSIPCYMNETGASQEAAEEHIKELIFQTWKKMNHHESGLHCHSSLINEPVLPAAANLARASHYFYYHIKDDHGYPDQYHNEHLRLLFFEPFL